MSARYLTFVLLFASWARFAHAEATPIDHGSFASPDGRFAFVLTPAQDGYHAAIKDLRAGTSSDSTLAPSSWVKDDAHPPDVRTPFDYQTNIYRVDWTRDSKTFAVVYHVADGSEIDVFHFDGKAWHEMDTAPTPVYPKCPYDVETEQNGNGPVIHYHEPSFNVTIFDEKAEPHTVWISYGIQTDISHRHSRLYICNFDFDPVTQKLSQVELHEVSIPEFLRLRRKRDYTRSTYPRE